MTIQIRPEHLSCSTVQASIDWGRRRCCCCCCCCVNKIVVVTRPAQWPTRLC